MKKIIIAVLALYIAGMLVWWRSIPGKPVTIVLPEGASSRQIAHILKSRNVISSPAAFLAVAAVSGRLSRLKSGVYSLSPRSSVVTVLMAVSEGKKRLGRVTIPEGFTAAQIADLLAEKKVVDRERFLSLARERHLEGFLFPQTYFFEPGIRETNVVERMQHEFRHVFTPAMTERAATMGMSEREIVIMASIIEKEAVKPEERSLIAGVFYNRLRRGQYLGSCATVQYVLRHRKARLSLDDVKVVSPYNTYRHRGLPPGPICNPGKDSIVAALYPAETEDLYFVADGTGTHFFSRSFKQHLRNKQKANKK